MKVQPHHHPSAAHRPAHHPAFARRDRPDPPEDDGDSFWRDIRQDVREFLFHFDQETIHDAGRLVKSIGGGLKGAWKQVRDIPKRIFNLPILKDKVDEADREKWADLGETLGRAVGFAAAGGHGLAGALKFASGRKKNDRSRQLEGLVDIATASVIGLSVAGLGVARAVAAPIAAGLNVLRGGYNAGQGFAHNDTRFQLQGVLDAVRSAGSFGRLLESHHTVFKVMGIGLAPLAGAIQIGRGVHDLRVGLRNDDRKKQLQGLADIAMAVGTGLAFASGVAVIPGVALAVAANLVKVGYQVSPKFRSKVDKVLNKIEPGLTSASDKFSEVTGGVRDVWKKLMSRLVKKVEAPPPEQLSRAEIAECLQLVHTDGDFSREEERRLKTVFEHAGQGRELPRRDQAPPALRRQELLSELDSAEERRLFMKFMIVVADYDSQIGQPEDGALRELAEALGISGGDYQRLRDEHERAKEDTE